MKTVIILLVLILGFVFVAYMCGTASSTTNRSGANDSDVDTIGGARVACFPGWSDAQYKDHLSTIADYMQRDDFEAIGRNASSHVKCSQDTAFGFYWTVYIGASSKMDHAPVSESVARRDFNSGWR